MQSPPKVIFNSSTFSFNYVDLLEETQQQGFIISRFQHILLAIPASKPPVKTGDLRSSVLMLGAVGCLG